MIQTFKKTVGFLGGLLTVLAGCACILSVIFWMCDPGNEQQRYRKAHLHHEDSPVWYLNQ
jgi:hypothetical protein